MYTSVCTVCTEYDNVLATSAAFAGMTRYDHAASADISDDLMRFELFAERPVNSLAVCIFSVVTMYTGAKTVVRTLYGNSNGFEVKLGLHQGSVL